MILHLTRQSTTYRASVDQVSLCPSLPLPLCLLLLPTPVEAGCTLVSIGLTRASGPHHRRHPSCRPGCMPPPPPLPTLPRPHLLLDYSSSNSTGHHILLHQSPTFVLPAHQWPRLLQHHQLLLFSRAEPHSKAKQPRERLPRHHHQHHSGGSSRQSIIARTRVRLPLHRHRRRHHIAKPFAQQAHTWPRNSLAVHPTLESTCGKRSKSAYEPSFASSAYGASLALAPAQALPWAHPAQLASAVERNARGASFWKHSATATSSASS